MVDIGSTEWPWKKWYNNHKNSFRNEQYANSTRLSKYICDYKEKHDKEPELVNLKEKKVDICNEGSENCKLGLEEKYYIKSFLDLNNFLNKRFKLVVRYCQENLYLLC